MLSNSVAGIEDIAEPSRPTRRNNLARERKPRKKRVQFSCTECRKKKLSCDRNVPCQRCVRTGRRAQCLYETDKSPSFNDSVLQQEKQIQSLQAQVAKLKALLSQTPPSPETGLLASIPSVVGDRDHAKPDSPGPSYRNSKEDEASIGNAHDGDGYYSPTFLWTEFDYDTIRLENTELSDPRERDPQGYYSRHHLFQFFSEVPELFPFIRETADEWLKPLGVYLTKDKFTKNGYAVDPSLQKGVMLETLLPPKQDTDALVSLYLDGLEQIHRIVHIPTFRREYTDFWLPERPQDPAMTTLILAMISISTCATTRSAEATSIPTRYHAMCTRWIYACDAWLKQQSPKHRKIVYYQISCLVYIAKRVAMVGKKRWWKETSSLTQDAIIDGLHCDSSSTDTFYEREMKRRIWATLLELDLQNAFEYGRPSLLHGINSDVSPPINVDDDGFIESSKGIPTPKPLDVYTFTSYQVHSARSRALRLKISERLSSKRLSEDLSYEEVLRYTHEIMQEIEAIPSWDAGDTTTGSKSDLPIVANAFCIFQLKECILALHRPYLQRNDGRYWLSETVCYHTSLDILLLNSRLAELGYQSLVTVRNDLLLASLSLVRIVMLQPKLSNSIMVANSQSAIDLLERCVPSMEDKHLCCFHSELWCFITMQAAIMLLKVHLEKESQQTAKAICARKFLDLHYRQMERQKMSVPNQWGLAPPGLFRPVLCEWS
ncbi:uncharacterized protein F4812DRAFT_451450 [Daldinia caldariorum]|uniref:uncharacterized protein n=1 Tax=Daldinia caldariorum TaxID=326644 RepID=UPI00200722A0|nr:uncharacterized protein F4812DRAFT_451450 [Daldinia caldariorum]KAI1467124.1 hypothetical protein F4812DRAFT_451450 [Daldinia caldariorum]